MVKNCRKQLKLLRVKKLNFKIVVILPYIFNTIRILKHIEADIYLQRWEKCERNMYTYFVNSGFTIVIKNGQGLNV